MQNYSNNSDNSEWLTDEQLFDIADELLFEVRFNERLEHLYNKYVQVNGIRMFDAITARLEQIKAVLDKPLRDELRDWNGWIIQEKEAGRVPDTTGLPKLAELRREQAYPTSSLFPNLWYNMGHISWQYVEGKCRDIEFFKVKKQVILTIEKFDNFINEVEATKKEKLTKRQKMLMYCYEMKPPLTTKDKDYKDYILFASPQKRLAYPNDSDKKRMCLIKDIEKIIPHLDGEYKKNAENELVILRGQK